MPSGNGMIQPGLPPGPSSLGMILSPSMEPIPPKLVQRITDGQFVEMRDLLQDNVTLQQQVDAIAGPFQLPPIPGLTRPRLRGVKSVTSWISCFLAYAAVKTTDVNTRNHLAYARLLIQEALRHGGMGWLDYDRVFRKQVAIDPTLQWNSLMPGLHTSTILSTRNGTGLFCTLCKGSDHPNTTCALTYLHHQGMPPLAPTQTSTSSRRPPRRPESMLHICVSWNKGLCAYPGTCTYRHVCATCQEGHKAKECPKTLPESEYKTPSRPWRGGRPYTTTAT